MNILVSNDDGYLAPGIVALAKALARVGRTVVVAPDRNRSGVSSALTLTQAVNTTRHSDEVYSVEGTPADCINIALGGLIPFRPDIVVSGINDGPNLADDTLYSGTVGAAAEGRFLGLPAIAISMGTFHAQHFATAGEVACLLVQNLKDSPFPQNTILNVNVPDLPFDELAGIESTRLGSRSKPEHAAVHPNPRGQAMYWLGAAGGENDNSEGTDFHAIQSGKVSVTPLTINMTRHEIVSPAQQWLDRAVKERDS